MQHDYTSHWEEKFSTRAWGRYPPEDLVRFMGRNYKHVDKSKVKVLEIGCGPGANLWFLHREGFDVAGIDISPTAIKQATERLKIENREMNPHMPDLKVGNFQALPWPDGTFDVAVDIFALYSNTRKVIDKALAETARVLKPGGRFYAKIWGRNTTGYGQGKELEEGTYDDIPDGPCQGMGVSHFSDHADVKAIFGKYFTLDVAEVVTRKNMESGVVIEEFHCQCTKAE